MLLAPWKLHILQIADDFAKMMTYGLWIRGYSSCIPMLWLLTGHAYPSCIDILTAYRNSRLLFYNRSSASSVSFPGRASDRDHIAAGVLTGWFRHHCVSGRWSWTIRYASTVVSGLSRIVWQKHKPLLFGFLFWDCIYPCKDSLHSIVYWMKPCTVPCFSHKSRLPVYCPQDM